MKSEQETMQIIKSFIRPLVRASIELVEEYLSEREATKERKEAPDPAPAPDMNNLVAETSTAASRREPSEEEKASQVFQALPERLKVSLRGLIGGDDLSAFESPAFSIERLWDFCKTEVQRPDGLDSSQEMAHLFEFFFSKLSEQWREKLFLYEPQAGEKFEPRRMTASNAGNKIGSVERTILKGYYSSQEHDGDGGDDMVAIKHKAVVVLR